MTPLPQRHAMVIGAGLAGAAVCAALARRGWRLTLLDAASGPAQGASALPVGMLSPHVTRAPTPLSRLSGLGVASTLSELQRLVPPGQGWQACEVDNRGHDAGRWPAAMVRPAALVQAWLDEAADTTPLHTQWNAALQQLQRHGGSWLALAADGRTLAEAPTVVVAAAYGSHALLVQASGLVEEDAMPLRPVKGQMSLATLAGAPLAPRPQRDSGVFVPLYEDVGLTPLWPKRLWAMGSTYDRGENNATASDAAHERNAVSLDALCPAAANQLRMQLAQGTLLAWAQVRCASLDRLPLAGALPDTQALRAAMAQAGSRRGRILLHDTPRQPGLFTLTALGSRGLTLAHWCAEQLAAQMDGEQTNDAHADLLKAVDPARFAWKQARRQPPT